ncbi:hypothetical protein OG21DRAFT_1604936 [Imleria badia]|nr:hypothetical protein OG21DRAFT_1604936 [Imleria badia]
MSLSPSFPEQPPRMRHTTHIVLHTGFYIAAALSGIAAAYVLNEWVLHWWDPRRPPDDETKPSSPSPPSSATDPATDVPAPVTDPEHVDPNKDAHTPSTSSLPPLRTHALPPPLPNGRALPGSSLVINPDAMASSTSLHSLGEESASESNTSDADTEPFVDLLSPAPTHVISRRRSFRNHDIFAASHISFSELGSLVVPEDEPHQ